MSKSPLDPDAPLKSRDGSNTKRLQAGKATVIIDAFLNDAVGYSRNGIKLCLENALKAHGYNWPIKVLEIQQTPTMAEKFRQAMTESEE
ncbi:MAG: hypothetical protein WC891_08765 [Actinomycetota bacterium]|jgi:hypothetical protein